MTDKTTEMDKTNELLQNLIETVQDFCCDAINEQRATREAITSLAEAIAGVRAASQPAETPTPESADAPEESDQEASPVTVADLRELFAAKSREGKKEALKALLAQYGAKKLPDLPENALGEVQAKARAL